MYQNLITPGSPATQGDGFGGVCRSDWARGPAATEIIQAQGDFNQTSNPLDMAIQVATGFFQVQMPDGTTAYTRNGSFHMNNQGTVVTSEGEPAAAEHHGSGECDEPDDLAVWGGVGDDAGADDAGTAGNDPAGELRQPGRAELAGQQPVRDECLERQRGDGCAGRGTRARGTLQQGYLENSNVDVVAEFVQMILAQRAYESNSKVDHDGR